MGLPLTGSASGVSIAKLERSAFKLALKVLLKFSILTNMSTAELMAEIETLPKECIPQVYDFIVFLRHHKFHNVGRKLGTLAKKGSVKFSENWHISDEELCSLIFDMGFYKQPISANK